MHALGRPIGLAAASSMFSFNLTRQAWSGAAGVGLTTRLSGLETDVRVRASTFAVDARPSTPRTGSGAIAMRRCC